ncbi:hypothetical protein LNQ52_24050 [Klebsiella pneumoniae subsp. pneumoniae]|nr:hypothetical protein [Klebsiella pneumoniae subsp. pneumoniae]
MLTHAADVDGVDPPAVKQVEFSYLTWWQPSPKVKPQPLRSGKASSASSRWLVGDHEAVFVVGDRQDSDTSLRPAQR